VVTRLNYGTTNSLNYSETLYEWSLGALITEGKLQIEHKNDKEETIIFIPGETPLSSNNNVAKSFNVAMDQLIFPIALSEGLLDLKDVMNNAMGGQGGLTVGRED
jgi:hypothetical protein